MSDPVLLLGIPSEPPLQMVARALDALQKPYVLWNQRDILQTDISVNLVGTQAAGVLTVADRSYALEAFGGIYLRLTDQATLPEVVGLGLDDPLRHHADEVMRGLYTWCEITPARVVNRLSAMATNSSKPLQAQLISPFFSVPETLVTNDPDAAREFIETHERVIYKSTSGERSIVQQFSTDDYDRLETLRHCPVQFQQHIEGIDVRVHTVVERVFATSVRSETIDYRYGSSTMAPYPLSDEVAKSCLMLAESLGIDVAGIDLRITPEGEIYCFEVNPHPAFSAYESATGQAISRAIAAYLANCACGC